MNLKTTILIFLCIACKQHTGEVATKKLPLSYGKLNGEAQLLFDSDGDFFLFKNAQELIELEKKLADNLLDPATVFTKKQRLHLSKIHHKLRSFLIYAVHSKCFMPPFNKFPRTDSKHRYEKRWQDRYDYHYYRRGNDERGNAEQRKYPYSYNLRIAGDWLCAIFLRKLKELTPAQIDLSQTNTESFHRVMDNKGLAKAATDAEMEIKVQKFFRETLARQIITNTEATMARAELLFPFHKQDYVADCQARRDHYTIDKGGAKNYRYGETVRKKINCQALQQLPSVTPGETTFADLATLTAEVNSVISALNIDRQALDKMMKETYPVEEVIGVMPGGNITREKQMPKHTVKKPFILPFLKLTNEANLEDNDIIGLYESYREHLTKATKRGIMPLIFASAMQKNIGSLHLNHVGQFFGFGKVTYKPLQTAETETVSSALSKLGRELIDSWVELQALRASSAPVEERKIYGTLLSHEIATAQVILQNPMHSVPITHLVKKFQHDPILPKWLRTFKNVALAADLAFIPIAILGGFMTGGVGVVPILLMANAVNFLWVGVASSEALIVRNRYRLIERGLLTGNSEEVARGLVVLQELREKIRNAYVSGAVGGGLTVANLGAIARGIDGAGTIVVDVTAAFTADIETLVPGDDTRSDSDVNQQYPRKKVGD